MIHTSNGVNGLERFQLKQSQESALTLWFVAFSDGKPIPTFPENARAISLAAFYKIDLLSVSSETALSNRSSGAAGYKGDIKGSLVVSIAALESKNIFLITQGLLPSIRLRCDDDVKMRDRELIEKAVSGCRNSFSTLVEAYYPQIYRLAWRFCGSQMLAEDIAQDVCVKLACAIRNYRSEAAFSTWIWRITYTTSIDRARAERHAIYLDVSSVAELIDADRSNHAPSPEDDAIYADLWHAVRNLPRQQRDAVILVYAEDMSHAEAAVVMGCQEKTVSWHLHEAKKRLKNVLEAAD